LAQLRTNGWRILLTPDNATRRDGFSFAIDNGAWGCHQKGIPFQEKPFVTLIEKYGSLADFVICPDIVAGGEKSLDLSLQWLPRLTHLRRVLLPVQDGMSMPQVFNVLRHFPSVGIFLGGSTEWKLRTLYDWGVLAAATGRWYHVGRVNTRRRIRLCAEAGATSFDGTSASMYAISVPRLEDARRQPSLLRPWRPEESIFWNN
jgi:hypothetical protein